MIKIIPSVLIAIHLSDLKNPNWTQKYCSEDNLEKFCSGKSYINCKHFSYPKLNTKVNKQSVKAVYDLGSDESFLVSVKDNKIKIITPNFGQIQLFYLQTKDWFFAADSFAALVKISQPHVKLELDSQNVKSYLYLEFKINEGTLFKGVKNLDENKLLIWDGLRVKVSNHLDLVDLVMPFALSPGQNKEKSFEAHLKNELSTVKKIGDFDRWSSCLSGGTDSTIVSILASDELPTEAYSVLVKDEPEIKRQQAVTNKICSKLHLTLTEIESGKIPLFEDWGELLLADPYIDFYANWSLFISRAMKKKKIDLIFAGMGADEYYKKKLDPRNFKPKFDENSDFHQLFNDSHEKKIASDDKNFSERISALSQSVSSSLLSYNTPWRNCGVWPVSPFISKAIISFSLYLSDEDKIGKIFLKRFASKKIEYNFPEWKTKISLSPISVSMLKKYLEQFKVTDVDEKIINLKILKLKELEKIINKYKQDENSMQDYTLFLILLIKLNRFIKLVDIL